MLHTRAVKRRAVALRRAGKSYRDINAALGISKGTLSGWFTRSPWSQAVRRDLERATRPMHRQRITAMARARSEKFAVLREDARRDARARFSSIVHDPLFTTGIALYWGEGDKHVESSKVRMSNIDPDLLRVFVRFLITYGGMERSRMHFEVLLYPDLDTDRCEQYWSKVLGIPRTQSYRAQVLPSRSHRRTCPHGVCIVSVHSRLLAERIAEWTTCLGEYLRASEISRTV